MAQSALKPLWTIGLKDTSLQQRALNVIPFSVKNNQANDLFVAVKGTDGFQISKINPIDGAIVWQRSRNQNINPNTDGKVPVKNGYTPLNMFLRKDGDIDVLAKANFSFPNTINLGMGCRTVIDGKTGVEKGFYKKFMKGGSLEFSNRGANFNRFIPFEDGSDNYHLIVSMEGFNLGTMTLNVDANIVPKDTILLIPKFDDSDSIDQRRLFDFHKIKDKFYYVAYYNNVFTWDSDTLGTQFVFFKYPKNNLLLRKNISPLLFNTQAVNNIHPISDGFLMSATADSNFSASNNLYFFEKTTNFITKVDTSGNLVWRTLWDKMKDTTTYYFRGIIERKDGKGYWVIAQSWHNPGPICIFPLDKNGKLGEKININLGFEKPELNPRGIWEADNGDLIGAYNITNCTVANADPQYLCNGIFYLKKSDLNQLTQQKNVPYSVENSVKVFPNPAHDKISLLFKTPQQGTVRLFDVQGRAAYYAKQQEDTLFWQFSLPSFAVGVYFLQIQTKDGQIQTEKILIE